MSITRERLVARLKEEKKTYDKFCIALVEAMLDAFDSGYNEGREHIPSKY